MLTMRVSRRVNRPIRIVLLATLAACEDVVAPIPDGSARLSGTMESSAGQAAAGVEVRLPFGLRRYYVTTTDSKGKFSLDFPVASFAGVSPVVVTTYAAGYRPAVFQYNGFSGGESYALNASGASALRPLAAGEFIPESSEGRLVHLGDASFGGEINSQLQTSTDGTFAVFKVATWTPTIAAAGYRNATIAFVARGMQSSRCPGNAVGFDNGSVANFTAVRPSDSPSSGDFARYTIRVPLPPMSTGNSLRVFMTTSTCGSSDFDDFELGELLVSLVP
jgi:hypothetical protein